MSLTVLLHSPDLEATREFYQTGLGFAVRDTAEGTITVEQSGGVLIFTSGNLWDGLTGLSGTIYFTVPDVDGYFASVNCASEGSGTTSAVVRPDGSLQCFQPYGKEGLLVADLDLSAATGLLASRCRTPM